jgi:hypothetical protein
MKKGAPRSAANLPRYSLKVSKSKRRNTPKVVPPADPSSVGEGREVARLTHELKRTCSPKGLF